MQAFTLSDLSYAVFGLLHQRLVPPLVVPLLKVIGDGFSVRSGTTLWFLVD